MTVRQEAWFWGVVLGLIIGFLWLFSDILAPFAAGLIIAYLLDPLADWLQGLGLPRWAAAVLAMGAFMFVGTAFLLLLAPALYTQIELLIRELPKYSAFVEERLTPLYDLALERMGEEEVKEMRQAVTQFSGTVINWITDFLSNLLNRGLALLQVLAFLIITPIVGFYFLRDYDQLFRTLDSWLPRGEAETIRDLVSQMNKAIGGFIRGQLTVALILGVAYATALSIVGLNGGLLIGFVIGVFSVVPYLGTYSGLVICVILAAFQFGTLAHVMLVAGIFGVGQLVADYYLMPRLSGRGAGLHAVVVIFSLLAGGQLFGLAGVLLGVPLAAVIAVLLRFAIQKYLESRFYDGGAGASRREDAIPATGHGDG